MIWLRATAVGPVCVLLPPFLAGEGRQRELGPFFCDSLGASVRPCKTDSAWGLLVSIVDMRAYMGQDKESLIQD